MVDLPIDEVIVHAASYHAERDHGYNERNHGLGLRLRHPESDTRYVAGTYRNSMSDQSMYIGVSRELWSTGAASLGYTMGAVVGYSFPIVPMLLPEGRLRFGNAALIVNWLPPIGRLPQVWGFSIGYKLK